MQIKFKRLLDTKGLLSRTVYCLEAMILPTREENELITHFNQWNDSLWLSSDHQVHDGIDLDMHKELIGPNLASLSRGHRFQFAQASHVITAEKVIREAVQNTLSSCRFRATFDGTDRVWEVTADDENFVTAG